MRCGICGRPLSNQKSVRRGIGPTCYKKYIQGDQEELKKLAEERRIVERRKYNVNVRNEPWLETDNARCKNCGKPIQYNEEDGCPDAYCCFPCCPHATERPCPREKMVEEGAE